MPDYTPPPMPDSQYEDPRDHQAKAVQDFLHKIAFLESSYGQNVNHPQVNHGINSGTSAVGQYGLMPLTAQDIDRQSGVNQLQDLPKEDVTDKLQNTPGLDYRLASTLASKLLSKNPSEVAAYKWEQGQNRKPSQEDLEQSQRVQRFRALNNVR